MSDEKWIVSDKDHLGGKPRVQGTRISVAFLLECLASGMSVDEIVDAYPTLTGDAVRGALQDEFVQQFMIAFRKTDWSHHQSGDAWPTE